MPSEKRVHPPEKKLSARAKLVAFVFLFVVLSLRVPCGVPLLSSAEEKCARGFSSSRKGKCKSVTSQERAIVGENTAKEVKRKSAVVETKET